MADLNVIAAVQPIDPEQAEIFPGFAGANMTAGNSVTFNSAGRCVPGQANVAGATQQFRGLALELVGSRQGISLLVKGRVAGFDLSAYAYGTLIYLSDNPGRLADVASGTKSVIVGQVVPMSDNSGTKALWVNAHQGWTQGY